MNSIIVCNYFYFVLLIYCISNIKSKNVFIKKYVSYENIFIKNAFHIYLFIYLLGFAKSLAIHTH